MWVKCGKCGHLKGRFVVTAQVENITDPVCPCCGGKGYWEDAIVKWVSTTVWYKPWTWNTGFYEEKESK